ncbi:MAG: citrate synthase [Coriobacteriia bacterium]|nr:citrate synthase [Coriobacteriia bacterium]
MVRNSPLPLYDTFERVNTVDPELYIGSRVKRGLRNDDGTGVVAGVTRISSVHGYLLSDGERIPDDGRLTYRGYDIAALLGQTTPENRFLFEEACYLLLIGELPTRPELQGFVASLDAERELPDGFTTHFVMNPPTNNIMNALERAVLILYADDTKAESRTADHEIMTAISLISRLPRIAVLSYYSLVRAFQGGSMIMHRFIPGQSTAETILSMLRVDRQFTPEEAHLLDIMLALHCEHGGGNNSTFACRVLTSSDTDPYSAYAAGIGSLKGSRHGGANAKVLAMQADIMEHVDAWDDEEELRSYLERIIGKEAFDGAGLIYGMGHAVYTKSDPRAVICKHFARKLAAGTEFEAQLRLLEAVERLTPEAFAEVRGVGVKALCANIDLYSGLVYRMLGIPDELLTPLFACSRMAGWAAHRFEEIVSGNRIMRPAYKAATSARVFVPRDER